MSIAVTVGVAVYDTFPGLSLANFKAFKILAQLTDVIADDVDFLCAD